MVEGFPQQSAHQMADVLTLSQLGNPSIHGVGTQKLDNKPGYTQDENMWVSSRRSLKRGGLCYQVLQKLLPGNVPKTTWIWRGHFRRDYCLMIQQPIVCERLPQGQDWGTVRIVMAGRETICQEVRRKLSLE